MSCFTCERDGTIARISIERPDARNAIAIDDWRALSRICEDLHGSDPHAVLIGSGVAGIFSAGADLGEFDALRDDVGARADFREAMGRAIEAVAALPMPVIAAIDDGCFGAAVALVMACDIRIAGDGAGFATTPAKLGLSYPADDVARLIGRAGRGSASLMLFSGARIGADRALAMGLVEMRAASAKSAGNELAQSIAANAPGAIAALKQVVRNPDADGHADSFDARFGSNEFADRLAAFRARKRT